MTLAENVKLSDAPEVSSGPWTSLEVRALERLAPLGAQVIADHLGRSVASVKLKAHRRGISLRQPDSRVGRLIGQPAGQTWTDARALAETIAAHARLRDSVVAGRMSVVDFTRALAALNAGAPLCPECTEHAADHPNGLCTACHRTRLADAHRAAIDAHQAQQDHWTARQAASRHNRKARS